MMKIPHQHKTAKEMNFSHLKGNFPYFLKIFSVIFIFFNIKKIYNKRKVADCSVAKNKKQKLIFLKLRNKKTCNKKKPNAISGNR